MKLTAKQFVPEIEARMRDRVTSLKSRGITPKLAIISSSNVPDIEVYIGQKIAKGRALGIEVVRRRLSADTQDEQEMRSIIEQLDQDDTVHGIIFQKPSDDRIDDSYDSLINPVKDVDGFIPGSPHLAPVYLGVRQFLQHIYGAPLATTLSDQIVTVIGRGKTGGGPIIANLRREGIPLDRLRIIDTRTTDDMRRTYLQESDIIISATGIRNPIDPSYIAASATVIDVGIHFDKSGKIQSDFDKELLDVHTTQYTTTPGGVGRLTALYLLSNVVDAAQLLNP